MGSGLSVDVCYEIGSGLSVDVCYEMGSGLSVGCVMGWQQIVSRYVCYEMSSGLQSSSHKSSSDRMKIYFSMKFVKHRRTEKNLWEE
jgi:hypothetical protein